MCTIVKPGDGERLELFVSRKKILLSSNAMKRKKNEAMMNNEKPRLRCTTIIADMFIHSVQTSTIFMRSLDGNRRRLESGVGVVGAPQDSVFQCFPRTRDVKATENRNPIKRNRKGRRKKKDRQTGADRCYWLMLCNAPTHVMLVKALKKQVKKPRRAIDEGKKKHS